MTKTKHTLWRILLVGLMALALTVAMAVRLLRLQLSAAASDDPKTADPVASMNTTIYTRTIPAMRGEILDRYGRELVTNSVTLDLRIDYQLWDKKKQNDVLSALLDLFDRYGVTYTDGLPISGDGEHYTSDRQGTTAEDRRLTSYITKREWDENIQADELFHKICQRYELAEDLEMSRLRRLAGLRYDLECSDFSSVVPYDLAENVPVELISYLSEHAAEFSGIYACNSYTRSYQTEYAAHLLGRVAAISQEEYNAMSADGYKITDRIGKDGAEKAFESYLRGVDGYEKLRIDSDGRVIEVLESRAPKAGDHVMLTMDIELQGAVEHALADQIALMVAEGIEDPTKAQDVAGGAVVVIDVNTGDILACASYPTYDISQFGKLFSELNEDPMLPMLNRAIGGIYSPGSVFKMVTSVAGLELGIITPETVITDTGIYTYYDDYQPSCWIYTPLTRATHGDETVVDAIRDSCNIFFFDVGRQIGIEQLSSYARAFGFGDYTGIELGGESRGYVASPEAKRTLEGKPWASGDTLAAAIGQSSNLFTPLQMANYIATLANGGTRYETHLLKYVCSNDYSSVVAASQAAIAGRVEMSQLTFDTVMEGMSEVTENGTAAGAFKNYHIHVGGKTGSAQVSSGTANGVFAAFAPFEDPQIAVVVIVEHSGSGNRCAPIARSIFDTYFALQETYDD